jgi:hypothetical protein
VTGGGNFEDVDVDVNEGIILNWIKIIREECGIPSCY